MEFLKDINWKADDGVFLPMINDVARNTFYDQIIKHNVRGRHCVDIGFGTGLLSMMALKHGASQITAYESDTNRWQLGQYIIRELGLDNQINLIHDQYTWQTPTSKDCVLISETVSPGIWGEGMWDTMPRQPGYQFLPGQLFFELHAVPVSQNILDLIETRVEGMNIYFSPGVDVDTRFVSLINQLMSTPYTAEPCKKTGIIQFDYYASPVWGGGIHHRLTQALGQVVAKYEIDIHDQTLTKSDSTGTTTADIDFQMPQSVMNVDLSGYDQPVLLTPRVGLRHNNISMKLDDAHSWHWMASPVIVTQEIKQISATHLLTSGSLEYRAN